MRVHPGVEQARERPRGVSFRLRWPIAPEGLPLLATRLGVDPLRRAGIVCEVSGEGIVFLVEYEAGSSSAVESRTLHESPAGEHVRTTDEDQSLFHIDLPGWCRITCERDPGAGETGDRAEPGRLLFARTTAALALGVPSVWVERAALESVGLRRVR